jgi:hypothetical protein
MGPNFEETILIQDEEKYKKIRKEKEILKESIINKIKIITIEKEKKIDKVESNVRISAQITSKARIKLLKAFKEVIKATKWGAFQTDWRMFKYFKPDFYKYFLNGKISSKKSTTVKYASADQPKKSTAKKTKKNHSVGGAKTRKQKSGFLGFLNNYTRKNK